MTSTEIEVTVKTVQDTKQVKIAGSATVEEFKIAIGKKFDAAPDSVRLILWGKLLENSDTLEKLGIQNGGVVHMLIQTEHQIMSDPSKIQSVLQNPMFHQMISNPSLIEAMSADAIAHSSATPNLFSLGSLGGLGQVTGGGLGGLGGPELQRMMQEIMSDPNMIQSVLQSPMFHQMISNPSLIEAMVAMGPMLSHNPEMAKFVRDSANQLPLLLQNDPNLFQQILQESGLTDASAWGQQNPTQSMQMSQTSSAISMLMNLMQQSGEGASQQPSFTEIMEGRNSIQLSQQPTSNAPRRPEPGLDLTFTQRPEVVRLLQNPNVVAALRGINFQPGSGSGKPNYSGDQQSPEVRYAAELKALNEMGYNDKETNIQVLVSTDGDVSAAIDKLTELQ